MCIPQIINHVAVEKGMEHDKGKILNHNASVGATVVGKKARLGTKQCQTVQKSSS